MTMRVCRVLVGLYFEMPCSRRGDAGVEMPREGGAGGVEGVCQSFTVPNGQPSVITI